MWHSKMFSSLLSGNQDSPLNIMLVGSPDALQKAQESHNPKAHTKYISLEVSNTREARGFQLHCRVVLWENEQRQRERERWRKREEESVRERL